MTTLSAYVRQWWCDVVESGRDAECYMPSWCSRCSLFQVSNSPTAAACKLQHGVYTLQPVVQPVAWTICKWSLVTSLSWRALWTVDDVERLIDLKKSLFIYSTLCSIWSWGITKIDRSQNSTKLYSENICLVNYSFFNPLTKRCSYLPYKIYHYRRYTTAVTKKDVAAKRRTWSAVGQSLMA